ncbi:MAG: hypothetical protein H3C55_10325 [Pseudorhodoplanes sp.]|nr:hypothetical protein [Pseudorhodoplanes sp.]
MKLSSGLEFFDASARVRAWRMNPQFPTMSAETLCNAQNRANGPGTLPALGRNYLEHNPAKRKPVRRKMARQNQETGARSGSI